MNVGKRVAAPSATIFVRTMFYACVVSAFHALLPAAQGLDCRFTQVTAVRQVLAHDLA
jgi:hypothetical protein